MALKLHLGCGGVNLPGFIHVDMRRFPHIDYQQSIADLSIFPDNSAELIYASHVFGGFDEYEAEAVLDEWKRVLAPGGILRLAVCDFEKLAEIYRLTGDLELILTYLYGRSEICVGKFIYNKLSYDFKFLEKLLMSRGFIEIKRYDYQNTFHKDYPDCSRALCFINPETVISVSLNMECKKPWNNLNQ